LWTSTQDRIVACPESRACLASLSRSEAPSTMFGMEQVDAERQGDPGEAAADRPASSGGAAPRPFRSRWVRRLGDILLIAGGLVLAYPFWSAGYAQVQQSRLDAAYRDNSAAFSTVAATAADTRSHNVPRAEVVRRLAVLYGSRLQPGDPIGRLRIPLVDLDRLVQQGARGRASLDPGADRALLRSGPVHYGFTPLPGAGEPFAVAGHRTTYGAPFYKLDRLKSGDRIFLDTPYARFRYEVAKTTVVVPGDIGVLRDRGYGLVLTTCTPPYSASHRLIVWAVLKRATPLKTSVTVPH
jgi:sortase A